MEEEAKSFLGALVEKEALFFFFLAFFAILIVALNGATFGTNTLNLQPGSIKILIAAAVILGALGGWRLTKEPSIKTKSEASEAQSTEVILQSKQEFKGMVQDQKTMISSLLQAIRDIQSIAVEERSFASNQILQVIEDLNIAVINYQEETIDAKLVAQWVRERIDRWLSDIKPEEYPNVAKKGEMESFRKDINTYLNLLCENITVGSFVTPKAKGIKSNENYFFAYKDALRHIRKKIVLEIEADEYPDFSKRQQQELLDSLDQLIDDIR